MKEIFELREKIEELTQQNAANLELIDGLRMQLEAVSQKKIVSCLLHNGASFNGNKDTSK